MKVYEILENVEFQTQVRFAYYDCEKCERIFLRPRYATEKEIRFMYVDDDEIIIEVEMED